RENFLSTMEIPLLVGRGLSEQDDAHSPKVVVVNQAFVKAHFPNENPIGKRFSYGTDNLNEIEIVGVARDAKYTSQRDEILPTVYQSWRQFKPTVSAVVFEVRTNGEPLALAASIRAAMQEVDRNLPLSYMRTQNQQADQTLSM